MSTMRLRWIPVFMLFAAGCGGGASVESFTPAADTAQEALTTALTAWQGGQKPGTMKDSKTAVEIADPVWQSGAKLTSFEIVKALDGDNPRQFSVKLVIDGAAPQEVVYVVVGKNTLCVMPRSEYDRTSGM
ncbi:MAG: hypothetical protein EXS05_16515 [Planctomycetaceae bacterium]|nr:hypothetical protein [Planctomycetaceae bacterium]